MSVLGMNIKSAKETLDAIVQAITDFSKTSPRSTLDIRLVIFQQEIVHVIHTALSMAATGAGN